MSTKSGPLQRAAAGQVEVVLDHHDVPRGEVLADAARRGGQDHRGAAGRDPGAQRVDRLGRLDPLVEVAAPAQDEEPAPGQLDRPAVRPVPGRGVGREEGERVERHPVLLGPEELGHAREAAAEHDEHVVMVDADAAGQLPGAAVRPLGRVVHGPDGRGCLGTGRVTSSGHALHPRSSGPAPPGPAHRRRDHGGPRDRLRQRPRRGAQRRAPLRLRRPVRPAQGAGARLRPRREGGRRPPGAHGAAPGPGGRRHRGRSCR